MVGRAQLRGSFPPSLRESRPDRSGTHLRLPGVLLVLPSPICHAFGVLRHEPPIWRAHCYKSRYLPHQKPQVISIETTGAQSPADVTTARGLARMNGSTRSGRVTYQRRTGSHGEERSCASSWPQSRHGWPCVPSRRPSRPVAIRRASMTVGTVAYSHSIQRIVAAGTS